MKFSHISLVSLLTVVACSTTPNPTATATVAADTAALVADIQADVASKTLTQAQLTQVNAQIAQLQADITALNAGQTGVTTNQVLSDVTTAITILGPFLPEIAMLATPAPASDTTTTPAPVINQSIATKAKNDYNKLKADVGASK